VLLQPTHLWVCCCWTLGPLWPLLCCLDCPHPHYPHQTTTAGPTWSAPASTNGSSKRTQRGYAQRCTQLVLFLHIHNPHSKMV
jgi:hypothetical protein